MNDEEHWNKYICHELPTINSNYPNLSKLIKNTWAIVKYFYERNDKIWLKTVTQNDGEKV